MTTPAELSSAAKTGDCKVLRLAVEKAGSNDVLNGLNVVGDNIVRSSVHFHLLINNP